MASIGIRREQSTTPRGITARWAARAAASAVAIGSLTAASAGVATAQVAPHAVTSATVVKVVTRAPFGKMLATIHGRSLYQLKSGFTCTGLCVSSWPRLLMPLHTTKPLGVRCLGTVKVGSRLQVTYRHKRLWLFTGDTGSMVTGNGLSGFKVAKLVTSPCP